MCVCVYIYIYSWITVLHIWGLHNIVNQLYINRNMSILPEQHKKPTLREHTHSHQGWTWLGKHSLQESGGTPGTLLQIQTLSPERKLLMWQDVVRLYCSFFVFAAALQKKPSALIQLTSQSAVLKIAAWVMAVSLVPVGAWMRLPIQIWGNVPEVPECWLRPQSWGRQQRSTFHVVNGVPAAPILGFAKKVKLILWHLLWGESANPLWKLERGVRSSEVTACRGNLAGGVPQARWGRAL